MAGSGFALGWLGFGSGLVDGFGVWGLVAWWWNQGIGIGIDIGIGFNIGIGIGIGFGIGIGAATPLLTTYQLDS